jgi:pSer/pThr/pTyr-binding forkhead associated (FHA) protein
MRARLIVESGAATPSVAELTPQQTIRLGRNSKNDIVLEDPHASRWHAELFHDGEGWLVRDCDTTNGTKINGIKIQKATTLENNQIIGIGDARLRFTLDPTSSEGTAELPVLADSRKTAEDLPVVAAGSSSDFSQTIFAADELTALLQFMTASLSLTTPHDLVNLALTTVLRQTQANVAGNIYESRPEWHGHKLQALSGEGVRNRWPTLLE